MPVQVLILKSAPDEGPGTIEDFLGEHGAAARVVEPGDIGRIVSLDGYASLVVMGGPMAVYEMRHHLHLLAAVRLIEQALKGGIRLLGVCLGAQMIAHCLGARVYRGHVAEVGWMDVELTPEGIGDAATGRLAGEDGRRARVFQWHGDTFELPVGATRLARSGAYENQAFKFGERAYALQFHVEVTGEMLARWFAGKPEGRRITEETRAEFPAYRARAWEFYRHFFV